MLAANDQLALGLLRAFSQAGVDVPGRVSVVGFDDVEGSDCFSPPLTTVRQPFADLGRMCMDLLLEQIGDSSGVQHLGRSWEEVRIPPMLLVRGSTAPPGEPAGWDERPAAAPAGIGVRSGDPTAWTRPHPDVGLGALDR